MKRPLLIKALTLTSFVSLMVVFILYHSGKFDGYIYNDLQTSHNGGVLPPTYEQDSIQRRRDSLEKVRMFSSKSGGARTGASVKMIDGIMIREPKYNKKFQRQLDRANRRAERKKKQ